LAFYNCIRVVNCCNPHEDACDAHVLILVHTLPSTSQRSALEAMLRARSCPLGDSWPALLVSPRSCRTLG